MGHLPLGEAVKFYLAKKWGGGGGARAPPAPPGVVGPGQVFRLYHDSKGKGLPRT